MEEVPNLLALLRGWVSVGVRGKGEDVEVVASAVEEVLNLLASSLKGRCVGVCEWGLLGLRGEAGNKEGFCKGEAGRGVGEAGA